MRVVPVRAPASVRLTDARRVVRRPSTAMVPVPVTGGRGVTVTVTEVAADFPSSSVTTTSIAQSPVVAMVRDAEGAPCGAPKAE